MAISSARKKSTPPAMQGKPVNLALQGGGAHGAFTWGVLDMLLEDGRVSFDGISATSAGAMNAVILAQGLLKGDRDEARAALENFWQDIADAGALLSPFRPGPQHLLPGNYTLDDSPFYQTFDALSRMFSPYEFNPFNINPLRDLLERTVDTEALRRHPYIKLHLCATNVETGKIRIFDNEAFSVDAVLASACLPHLFQTVEVEGEYFWDGGYLGNPAIFPLIYNCHTDDVIIVHINPIMRQGVPRHASEILNRINEISFNAVLMSEMRAIAFVSKLIREGRVRDDEMKNMRIHAIRSDELMAEYDISSKVNTDWNFLLRLRDQGRELTRQWLDTSYNAIGHQSSVDLKLEYL